MATSWDLRLAADNHDGELRNQRGDCTDGGKERSQDGADGSDGHGDFDERVAMLVRTTMRCTLPSWTKPRTPKEKVAAQYMNLFNKTLATYSLDYVGSWRQVPMHQIYLQRDTIASFATNFPGFPLPA